MPNSYYLIRHGQTDWNLAGRWQGKADQPLNATGHAQAAAIAKRLANHPIHAIYSSDSIRAAATAQAIALPYQLSVQYESALQERGVGIFEGMTRQDILEQYPASYKELQRGIFNPIGGETSAEVQARAVPIFEQIVANHPDESVVIASHGGTIVTILAHVLRLPIEQSYRLSSYANCALTRIENTSRGLRLVQLNDVGHLEGLFA